MYVIWLFIDLKISYGIKLILKDVVNSKNIHYLKGQFYMITRVGVWVIDIATPSNQEPRLVVEKNNCGLPWPYKKHFYLVEVSGALLLIARYSSNDKFDRANFGYKTYAFQVWELDLIKGEAKRIKLLGDRAILLWYNASTSIDPSKIIGVKPNHIYFTDLKVGVRYKFAYSLEDGKIQSFVQTHLVDPFTHKLRELFLYLEKIDFIVCDVVTKEKFDMSLPQIPLLMLAVNKMMIIENFTPRSYKQLASVG
ncbi:hypothetical protein H5410_064244 [Solanum commersonii]|uniref:KIB1-4 beta-propeller domain-containing protein n=1 Tax=Solanum commersonii TaxID=4109 RepID=A0A9J5W016_SOLCO|nr:hypothetical protein H5410_064244 [Solanum commersonii]